MSVRGDALEEARERARDAARNEALDEFIDEVLEATQIDGLPRPRNEGQAEAMSDVVPILSGASRARLRGKLWLLIQSWMDAERENGVL